MPEIHETALPGVGVRYELTVRTGAHLGVVAHRHGRRDLVLYDTVDPDAVREAIRLTEAESSALAALLGGSGPAALPGTAGVPGVVAGAGRADDGEGRDGDDGGPAPRPGSVHRIGRFAVDWVPVPPGSPYAGRSIATAGVRSITGVSIVAVLRADAAYPSPGPDFRLEVGDTALVVGTPDGVEALVELLED